jgi:hypothetical protein
MKLKFRPSDFSRWGTCTASPAATAGVKSEQKSYAAEGTVAHELHAICLSMGLEPRSFIGDTIEVKDLGPSKIDADMAEAVDESIQYVNDHVPAHWERFVEHKVDLSWLVPDQKGVVDLAAFDQENCTELHILDYKHGKGVKVFAEKNGELMLHALGVTRDLMNSAQRSKLEKIVLHILQPRIGHLDRWELTKGELERFAVQVQGKHVEALDPEKRKFVPSIEGCRFCPIKHDCRTLKESIFAKILDDPNGVGVELKDPDRMSPEELAGMHEWFDFIGAWATNAKDHMLKSALKGTVYPGLKLIKGRAGKNSWVDEDKAEQYMREEKKLEDFEIFEQVLISPSKFETQVGKKNAGDLKKLKLVKQSDGSPQLVSEDTPGAPWVAAELSEFDDITGAPNDE